MAAIVWGLAVGCSPGLRSVRLEPPALSALPLVLSAARVRASLDMLSDSVDTKESLLIVELEVANRDARPAVMRLEQATVVLQDIANGPPLVGQLRRVEYLDRDRGTSGPLTMAPWEQRKLELHFHGFPGYASPRPLRATLVIPVEGRPQASLQLADPTDAAAPTWIRRELPIAWRVSTAAINGSGAGQISQFFGAAAYWTRGRWFAGPNLGIGSFHLASVPWGVSGMAFDGGFNLGWVPMWSVVGFFGSAGIAALNTTSFLGDDHLKHQGFHLRPYVVSGLAFNLGSRPERQGPLLSHDGRRDALGSMLIKIGGMRWWNNPEGGSVEGLLLALEFLR